MHQNSAVREEGVSTLASNVETVSLFFNCAANKIVHLLALSHLIGEGLGSWSRWIAAASTDNLWRMRKHTTRLSARPASGRAGRLGVAAQSGPAAPEPRL